MTVVINHDIVASVVWCAKGFGKRSSLSHLGTADTGAESASIRCASADGAKWIASRVERIRSPCFAVLQTRFSVAGTTDALDQVRWKPGPRLASSQKSWHAKRSPSSGQRGEAVPEASCAKPSEESTLCPAQVLHL